MKRILITIPCYNEEEGISKLVEEIEKVRQKIDKNYAIDMMMVDDGSQDGTREIIERLAKEKKFIYYRIFASNAGHQSALRAGIESGVGYDAVIMMDADLQHPPEYIPKMIEVWSRNKVDIVQMLREDQAKDVGVLKFTTSKLYYRLLNKISGLDLKYGSSDFRLIDKKVVDVVIGSHEPDLFLRGYFTWLNLPTENLNYVPAARFTGKSKYTFKKMFNLAGSGILQFSDKPLRFSVGLGVSMSTLAVLYSFFILVRYLNGGYVVNGWMSLILTILFCFGANFVILGILGMYLAQSITISKRRPQYIISKQKLPK